MPYVQHDFGDGGEVTGTLPTISFVLNGVTAGNCIVASMQGVFNFTTPGVGNIADDRGTTSDWEFAGRSQNGTSNSLDVFYLKATASGNYTITITGVFSGGSIRIEERDGQDVAAALEDAQEAHGNADPLEQTVSFADLVDIVVLGSNKDSDFDSATFTGGVNASTYDQNGGGGSEYILGGDIENEPPASSPMTVGYSPDNGDDDNTLMVLAIKLAGSANNPITGTSDMSITGTASIRSKKNITGISAIAMNESATIGSIKWLTGTSTMSMSGTATISKRTSTSATSTINMSQSGVARVRKNMTGASSISITGTANIRSKKQMTGTSSLAIVATANLTRRMSLNGSSSIALSNTGNVSSIKWISGASTITMGGTAALGNGGQNNIAGQSSITITGTANIVSKKNMTGASSMSMSGTANIGRKSGTTGSGSMSMSGVANMQSVKEISGTSTMEMGGTATLESRITYFIIEAVVPAPVRLTISGIQPDNPRLTIEG